MLIYSAIRQYITFVEDVNKGQSHELVTQPTNFKSLGLKKIQTMIMAQGKAKDNVLS